MVDFLSTVSLKCKLGLPEGKNSTCRSAGTTFRKSNDIILHEYNQLERREEKHFIVDDSIFPGKGKM
jgi:hypothetical protein